LQFNVSTNFFCSTDYQAKHIHLLNEIDSLKATNKISTMKLLQNMIVDFSQQSCAIEGNTLGTSESLEIWDILNRNHNINNLLEYEKLPPLSSFAFSDESENEIIEIRNHLLATYFVFNRLPKLKQQEISIDKIKKIHRIMLKDINNIHKAGEFRTAPVRSFGYNLTVYPVSFNLLILFLLKFKHLICYFL
jgi:hypothetical protein